MERRGFLKAMVAAAGGLLALTPRVIRSVSAGTLTPAWSKEDEKRWTLGTDRFIESCMWNTDDANFVYHSAYRPQPPI